MVELGGACITLKNTNGILIELNKCPSLLAEYGLNTENLFISDLYSIVQGYNFDSAIIRQNPIVCCDDPSTQFKSTSGSDETCTDPNGLSGVCKNIKECPAILSQLNARISDESFVRYLRNSNRICNFHRQNVCCHDKQTSEYKKMSFRLPTVEEGCGIRNRLQLREVTHAPPKPAPGTYIPQVLVVTYTP